jgi:hypothetical protein
MSTTVEKLDGFSQKCVSSLPLGSNVVAVAEDRQVTVMCESLVLAKEGRIAKKYTPYFSDIPRDNERALTE